jgi:hypothetical protein
VVPVDVRATSAAACRSTVSWSEPVRNRSASSSLMPCLAAIRRRRASWVALSAICLGVGRSLLRLLEVGEVGGGDVVELLLQRGGVLLGRGASLALGLERLLAVLAQRLVVGLRRVALRRRRGLAVVGLGGGSVSGCRTCVLPRGVAPSTSRRREVLADVAGGDEPLDGVVTEVAAA